MADAIKPEEVIGCDPPTASLLVETRRVAEHAFFDGRSFMELEPPRGYALFHFQAIETPGLGTSVALVWARLKPFP